MNTKEAIVVSMIVLAGLVGTVFADSQNSPTSTLAPQITSVDLEALRVVPGLGSGSGTVGVLIFNGTGTRIDFTTSFSFSPAKGFTQINSVTVTLIYAPDSAPENSLDMLNIKVNSHQQNPIPIPFFAQFPISGFEPIVSSALKIGANELNVSILHGGPLDSAYYLYEAKLVIEYTYLG